LIRNELALPRTSTMVLPILPTSWRHFGQRLLFFENRPAIGCLLARSGGAYTSRMQVHLTPELASKLNDLAAATGRAPDQLVEDAVAAYLEELE
jgi:hypothetical protein